jgi:hypothetical protein
MKEAVINGIDMLHTLFPTLPRVRSFIWDIFFILSCRENMKKR